MRLRRGDRRPATASTSEPTSPAAPAGAPSSAPAAGRPRILTTGDPTGWLIRAGDGERQIAIVLDDPDDWPRIALDGAPDGLRAQRLAGLDIEITPIVPGGSIRFEARRAALDALAYRRSGRFRAGLVGAIAAGAAAVVALMLLNVALLGLPPLAAATFAPPILIVALRWAFSPGESIFTECRFRLAEQASSSWIFQNERGVLRAVAATDGGAVVAPLGIRFPAWPADAEIGALLGADPGAPLEGALLTPQATSGWRDWTNRELWLFADGLLAFVRGARPELPAARDEEGARTRRAFSAPEIARLGAAPGARLVGWGQVERARLRRGPLVVRLELRLRDGGRVRFRWPRRDEGAAELRELLGPLLGERFRG